MDTILEPKPPYLLMRTDQIALSDYDAVGFSISKLPDRHTFNVYYIFGKT